MVSTVLDDDRVLAPKYGLGNYGSVIRRTTSGEGCIFHRPVARLHQAGTAVDVR
jgi:hypothetical protein